MMDENLDANFTPDMDFFSSVAQACKEILYNKMPREKVLSRYLKHERNRKYRDKLFKYVQSIIKNSIILDFVLSRVGNAAVELRNDARDVYFTWLCIVFHVFEHRILEREFLPFSWEEKTRTLDSLNLVLAESGSETSSFVESLFQFNMQNALANLDFIQRWSVLYSHPSFFVEKLLTLLPRTRLEAILKAHQSSEQFFVVARDDATSKRIKTRLVEKGFAFQEDRALPNLLHIPNIGGWKHDLLDRTLRTDKDAMIQDLGSVAIIEALDIRPGDEIIDGCAAPFQKTINMYWHCGPAGRIVAFDAHLGRTMENAPRLGETARKIIHIVNADTTRVPLTCRNLYPDKILLDVPCTGSGSLGAFPELKERQNEREIKRFARLQYKIISSMIEACTINRWMDTEIVYSTCSYYPEEGESMIDSFWNKIILRDLHDLNGDGVRIWQLAHGWKGYRCSRFVARTFPDVNNGSKAFFIAKFTIAPKS